MNLKELFNNLKTDNSPETRRELAERVNRNPEDFLEFVDFAFNPETGSFEAKNTILNLVDLYTTRLTLEVIEKAVLDADPQIRVRGLRGAYRSRVDSLNPVVEKMLRNVELDFETRKWSIHILGTTDPEHYKRLLRRTAREASEDMNLRKEAIFALTEEVDDEALGTLCALLGDPSPEIRKSVAWALSNISSPDTTNCLLAALEDENESVRDWAIRGLRDMDDSRALEKLADALVDGPPEEQVRIVRLVAEKRSEVIQRGIVVLLDSNSVDVRRVAAWAMGVSPYPPAVASLKTLLDDVDSEVRDYARVALIRSGVIEPSDLQV